MAAWLDEHVQYFFIKIISMWLCNPENYVWYDLADNKDYNTQYTIQIDNKDNKDNKER